MRGVNKTELLVMTVAKAIIAVVLVGVVAYSVVAQVPISEPVMQLVFLVMAACFGFDAWLTRRAWTVAAGKKKRG